MDGSGSLRLGGGRVNAVGTQEFASWIKEGVRVEWTEH